MARKKFIALLHAKGMTYRSLGKKLGIHYTFLNHMANGRRMPTLDRAVKLAKALDVSLEDLFRSLPKVTNV